MVVRYRSIASKIVVACLFQIGCGSPPAAYQDAQSDDSRCICHITEYDDPKDGNRLLDLHITLDKHLVLERSYFGRKRWDGEAVQFAVGKANQFYYLFVVGHPDYALAIVETADGGRWFQSTDESSEQIVREFRGPKLTDLNSLNAYVLRAGG